MVRETGCYTGSGCRRAGLQCAADRQLGRLLTRLSDKQFNSMDGVDCSKKESEELRRLRRKESRAQIWAQWPQGMIFGWL